MEQYGAKAVPACGGDRNVFNNSAVRDPVMSFLDALVPAAAPKPEVKPAPLKLPALYRRTRVITAVLFFAGIAAMYLDLRYSLTPLGTPFYIVWCLSCASMFFTNNLAVKEWKQNNGRK